MNTHLRLFTIAEYTKYILDDPRVKAIIDAFVLYRSVADKMIDSFDFLLDEGILTFKTSEEMRIAREFNQASEATKRAGLARIIEGIHSFPDRLDLRAVIGRNETDSHPNITDIPLIMFKAFATHPQFADYLYTGRIDLLSGAYLTKEMDLVRQKYLVFALFIWVFYDAKSLFDRRSETYYDEAPIGISTLPSNASNTLITMARRISTSTERLKFLALFRDYIHFDMFSSDDYAKKSKRGTVLRLRLSTSTTGQVVLQVCEGATSVCNTVYLITSETVAFFTEKYLTHPDIPLERLGYFFPCRVCHSPTAQFFFANDNDVVKHFYCGKQCYTQLTSSLFFDNK